MGSNGVIAGDEGTSAPASPGELAMKCACTYIVFNHISTPSCACSYIKRVHADNRSTTETPQTAPKT
eukprot:1144832-Pelagomonas_calceolata.AAC.3